MSKLKAIKNRLIFQFLDSIVRKDDMGTTRTQFAQTTDWGFEISNYDEGAKSPRWGVVTSVGPDVIEDIEVGSTILIEALQWTDAIEIEGEKFWGTDEIQVMAIQTSA